MVADLYVELNCYKEAIEWFEKGYKECWKSPNWIGRFVYALYKVNNSSRIHEVIRNLSKQNSRNRRCRE